MITEEFIGREDAVSYLSRRADAKEVARPGYRQRNSVVGIQPRSRRGRHAGPARERVHQLIHELFSSLGDMTRLTPTLAFGFLIDVVGASIIGFLPFVIVCALIWIVYANL